MTRPQIGVWVAKERDLGVIWPVNIFPQSYGVEKRWDHRNCVGAHTISVIPPLPQIRKCHFLSDPCVFGYIFKEKVPIETFYISS